MPLQDFLKPEYKNSPEAKEIAELFSNTNPKHRMVLRVPVDVGDAITRFLKRAVDPAYRFNRRTGGGPRYDSMRITCLRKDATYFKYYFDKRYVRYSVPNCYCSACGQQVP